MGTTRLFLRLMAGLTLGLLALAVSVPARAQMAPGGGVPSSTPLPMAVDLKKAKIGSWAEYRLSDGHSEMKVHMALVGRSAAGADIETQISGGPIGGLGSATMRMTLTLGPDGGTPTQHMMQLGSNDPMSLPDLGGNGKVLKRPDAKSRVGVESLKVPAGTFPHADHYRDTGPNGQTIEFWTSADVPPFGVLKVQSQIAGQPQTMELLAHGGGAKRVITKKPKPYDPAVLMQMLQAGGAAPGTAPAPAAGAGGPKAAAPAKPQPAGASKPAPATTPKAGGK